MKITSAMISIPAILKTYPGALFDTGKNLKEHGISKVSILFGNNLISLFGDKLLGSLKEAEVEVLEYMELDNSNIEDITAIAFALPNETQAIIGIGGGKVIDAAKYAGFLRDIPFISIPTSSSSDGFASASASLLVGGRRKSVPARMAYGLIIDVDIIRSAPDRFLYSGIGDMVSKITALYDWQFEAAKGVSEICDSAVMIAKKAVNSFVRTPFKTIHDDVFLKELLDSLTLSGIANEIAGSSLPTSGSEHLISHALDKYAATPQLHGVQVGIATYIMSIVQEHRELRVRQILTDTGFFSYVKDLKLDIKEYEHAIEKACEMKPFRHTYLHEERYVEAAKKVLYEDEILRDIFNLD